LYGIEVRYSQMNVIDESSEVELRVLSHAG